MIDPIVKGVTHSKLIQRKEQAGLTYSDIARIVDFEPSQMPPVFRGERPWRVSTLSKVLDLLDLTIEDVLKDQMSLNFYHKWLEMANKEEG